MKKKLLLLYILLIPVLSFSQIQFKENVIIEKLVHNAWGIYAADLDLDEDLDLLVASSYDNKISWFRNEGMGNFGQQFVITTNAKGAMSVFAIDLDGDGDKDVISASNADDKIAWYKNDGFGNFGAQQLISTLTDYPTSVFAIDLDGDGDNDVISVSVLDNKVAWYENDSLGNFGPQQIISTSVFYPYSVYAIDLDSDGDNDVLSASILDNKIAWYENLGNGSFGNQQIITTQALQPKYVCAIDLDGDGDNDVISASTLDNKIAWYENDSLGVFGPPQIISSSFEPSSVYAGDLDGDGDNDIVSNSSGIAGMVWFENNGSGIFGYPILIDSLIISRGLSCADFDNDGDLDIAATNNSANINWYTNDSMGNFGSPQNITFGINAPSSLFLSDLDNDGQKDIVCGSGSNSGIVWFKNYGFGAFVLEDTVAIFSGNGIRDLSAADFDGDGDEDVLVTISDVDKIVWYENDGQGNFGSQQIISDSSINSICIIACDLDNDGDNDVLYGSTNSSSSMNDSKLSWWKNNGSGNFGSEIVLSQGVSSGVSDVSVADLDNDGDNDILYARGQVFWRENLGGANFFTVHFISAGIGFANRVLAADLDGDNDLDVVCSADDATGNGDIRWWKNNGSGNFTAMPYLATWLSEPYSISTNDLDNDGDMDIIGQQNLTANSLFWFPNDGVGNFGTIEFITDSMAITSLISYDLDEDGDCDILYNSIFKGKILWAENLGYRTQDSSSACANQPFAFGNQILTSPGIYHDTLQTIFGLDSVIELELSHIPVPAVSLAPFSQDTFCMEDEFIDFPMASPLGGAFSGAGVGISNINLYQADTGTHEISYHYTDTTTGCSNSDTTQLVVVSCLSIPEAEHMGVSVYPNPTSNFITIACKNIPALGKTEISLFDISAKELSKESPSGFPFQIDISHLKAGVYYLHLYNGEITVVWKVVKR